MFPEIFVRIDEVLYPFSLYDILMGIGVIVFMMFVIRGLEKKNHYSHKDTNRFLIFIVIALVVTYVFASFFNSLFHYIGALNEYADRLIEFQQGLLDNEPIKPSFTFIGLTFISGLLGGLIAFVLLIYFFMKKERGNILKILNIIIPGVVLAHAIGRLGCFTAGCCYGVPTNSFLGIFFPDGTQAHYDGVRDHVHPTQLYEAFFLFALFFVLVYIRKIRDYKFAIYLIAYGIFRYLLETFFRGDNRGLLFNMPPSLLLSILMVVG